MLRAFIFYYENSLVFKVEEYFLENKMFMFHSILKMMFLLVQ
mgnify:CR=1 FL=1